MVKYYCIVEVDGIIRSGINAKGQPSKYEEPKQFASFEAAKKWVEKHSYKGMSVYYQIVAVSTSGDDIIVWDQKETFPPKTIRHVLPNRPVNVRIIKVDDNGHTINRTSFLRDPRNKDELGILDSEYLSVIPGQNWYTFVLLDKAAEDEKGV